MGVMSRSLLPQESIRYTVGLSSLGPVLVAASEAGLCAVLFGADEGELLGELKRRFSKTVLMSGGEALSGLLAAVTALIESPRAVFEGPIDPRGTAFQQEVWRALRDIPAGSTASYGELARRVGRPQAVRAVAQACGANPLAVVVPCHRVLRNDGGLSGYRWGVERKQALLLREVGK